MEGPPIELVADEIRAIRERLGLSQAEAGKVLGGGPSAFTKYEAGTLRPAASLVNLLRVLEANPAAITTLGGRMPHEIAIRGTGPFEVTGRHIEALTDRAGRMLPELLRRLLVAEAQANDVPASGVHVASSINTPDGGEDGRIEWTGGPDHTRFLPGRLCQFQLKGGRIKPSDARRDVLATSGEVKDMVRSVLDAEGHYIMLCSYSYSQKQIGARERSIREGLCEAGVAVADEQIDFRDADQIARWTNQHPSVAIWVKEQMHGATSGPFHSWSHWAGRPEHERSPWIDDGRLPALLTQLRERIMTAPGIARVVGPWGVGKSRLVLEALSPPAEGDADDRDLSDFVLYAVESENGSKELYAAVQKLVDAMARAVVVVDCCLPQTHRILAGTVSRSGSRVSLITIDDDLSGVPPDETTIKVDEAPTSVIEAIVQRSLPGLPSGEQNRLARFSTGYPEIAIRIGEAWRRSIPIGHTTDDGLVDAIVQGHRPDEPALMLKSAKLIAVFGMVRFRADPGARLGEIATLGRNLTADDLRATIEDFVRRGVVQRRGRYVVLRPRALALNLSERQWREWSPERWDAVLSGNTSADLKVVAARGLALLNTTDISQEVVAHVCRIGGGFDGWNGISRDGHAEVLSRLSEIDTRVVFAQIDRSLAAIERSRISGEIRRHLVRALEKVAFRHDTFSGGARMLLSLAIAENETCSNNATGQFTSLFPSFLGNTEADGTERLALLGEVAHSTNDAQREVIVQALAAGSKTAGFWTLAGAERHGTRQALERWSPTTHEQFADYIKGCVTRLVHFAKGQDSAAALARGFLAAKLGSLFRKDLVSMLESAVIQVHEAVGYWPQALDSIGRILARHSDSMDRAVIDCTRRLIGKLQPTSLEMRVRFLVTDMPIDYPYERDMDFHARQRRQMETVHALALEIVQHPTILKRVICQLSQGEQRMAYTFGQAVATHVESPLELLDSIIGCAEEVPRDSRNHDLLCGYVAGITADYRDAVETLKRRMAKSHELAPALPRVCLQGDITASDVELVVAALRAGRLRASDLKWWRWDAPNASTSAISVLLDAMLDQGGEALSDSAELLVTFVHSAPDRLDDLRRQVVRLVKDVIQPGRRGRIDLFVFREIVKWMLYKGRQDSDASAVALLLARALIESREYDAQRTLEPLLPLLLSEFPEITWSLIGSTIVADDTFAMRMEFVLGDHFAFDEAGNPAILSLPENALFAWCHCDPDRAPAFAAAVVPVLTPSRKDAERSLHPIMARLIDEFGDCKKVLDAIDRNIMHNFSWRGSLTTYYAVYRKPLHTLLDHPKPEVGRWAARMLRRLEQEIENARNHDEEVDAKSELG